MGRRSIEQLIAAGLCRPPTASEPTEPRPRTCKRGHPRAQWNTYTNPTTGHRACKACKACKKLYDQPPSQAEIEREETLRAFGYEL